MQTRRRIRPLPALLLTVVLAVGCDMTWERRAETEYQNGVTSQERGNFAAARDHYLAALVANPYHPGANFGYADCLDIRDQNTPLALAHFQRYLDLPSPPRAAEAQERITRLQALAEGSLEDPVDALADLLWAAGSGILPEFVRRLHDDAIAFAALEGQSPEQMLAEWAGWGDAERLRREFDSGDGGVRALVLVRVPDGFRQLVFLPSPHVEGSWLLQQATRLGDAPTP